MEICPHCGRVMQFNMSYNQGAPFVYYTCECGYNTSRLKSYATTNTDYVPVEYYDYYIPTNTPVDAIWVNGYDGLRCSNCWHKCETTAAPNRCPNCGSNMSNYWYTANSYTDNLKIYPGVIRDTKTNEIVGEIIPCRNKKTGEEGLYNTYEDKFYNKTDILKRVCQILSNGGKVEWHYDDIIVEYREDKVK